MKKKLHLIAYDIADPKRLGQVARYMCQHAYRVQYSVFVASLSSSQLEHLLFYLEEIIDPRWDDIRAYPLPSTGDVTLLENQFFATNTLLAQNSYGCLELLQDDSDSEYLLDEFDN